MIEKPAITRLPSFKKKARPVVPVVQPVQSFQPVQPEKEVEKEVKKKEKEKKRPVITYSSDEQDDEEEKEEEKREETPIPEYESSQDEFEVVTKTRTERIGASLKDIPVEKKRIGRKPKSEKGPILPVPLKKRVPADLSLSDEKMPDVTPSRDGNFLVKTVRITIAH